MKLNASIYIVLAYAYVLILCTSCSVKESAPFDHYGNSYFGAWEKQSVIDLTQNVIDLSRTQLRLDYNQHFTLRRSGQKDIPGTFSSQLSEDNESTYFVFVTESDTVIRYYQYIVESDRLLFLPEPGTSGDTIRWERITW